VDAFPGGFEPDEGEDEDDDTSYEDMDTAEAKAKPRTKPFGGVHWTWIHLVQQLGIAVNGPSSEYDGDRGEFDIETLPPIPPIPIRFQDTENVFDEGESQ